VYVDVSFSDTGEETVTCEDIGELTATSVGCEFYAIDTAKEGLNGAIADLLGGMLERGGLDAVLVPCANPYDPGRRACPHGRAMSRPTKIDHRAGCGREMLHEP